MCIIVLPKKMVPTFLLRYSRSSRKKTSFVPKDHEKYFSGHNLYFPSYCANHIFPTIKRFSKENGITPVLELSQPYKCSFIKTSLNKRSWLVNATNSCFIVHRRLAMAFQFSTERRAFVRYTFLVLWLTNRGKKVLVHFFFFFV